MTKTDRALRVLNTLIAANPVSLLALAVAALAGGMLLAVVMA